MVRGEFGAEPGIVTRNFAALAALLKNQSGR